MSAAGTRLPWGVWFEPTQPVTRLVALAALAEELGAQVCLVADEGTERDVYVALTAILAATDALVVGPAITNPFSRHPVTTAAAVATLAEMAPGRVWHGLGVGGSRVLSPLQLEPERPYSALVDAFAANRRLLAGRRVGPAALAWFEGDVPMAVAGRGPRVQRFAAAEADWVILSAKARADLPDTATAIRGAGHARIAWSAYVAYDETERRRALRHFAYMALDAPAEHLPESLLDLYAVTGTPTDCATTIAALRDHFDLFVLPMNDEATCEAHIAASAEILARAGRSAADPR